MRSGRRSFCIANCAYYKIYAAWVDRPIRISSANGGRVESKALNGRRDDGLRGRLDHVGAEQDDDRAAEAPARESSAVDAGLAAAEVGERIERGQRDLEVVAQ